MIRWNKCRNGHIWMHLDVKKLTHSILRDAKKEARVLAKEHGYPTVFCLVPNGKYKLAKSWGFRLCRKVEVEGEAHNLMTMESHKC